ncbi:hypothetical protein [Micromonospora globispora]|uniref:hypothetical protein n=1 Tax=Micromonospora globispora TaxID=1450148 RepID=UPI000F4EE518|nr:hypothetical protein [Micromonospora globispora]
MNDTVSNSPDLKKTFRKRLFNFRLIRPSSLIPIVVIMPVVVVVATLLSLPFEQSIDRLKFADGFSFSVGVAPNPEATLRFPGANPASHDDFYAVEKGCGS